MGYKVERLDYAALDALIRRARARRDRELARLIGRGAKALAGLVKTTYTALVARSQADRERSSPHARAALRRWAGRS
jgi:hypothetical protein